MTPLYTIDHPRFIVSYQVEESIKIQRVNANNEHLLVILIEHHIITLLFCSHSASVVATWQILEPLHYSVLESWSENKFSAEVSVREFKYHHSMLFKPLIIVT